MISNTTTTNNNNHNNNDDSSSSNNNNNLIEELLLGELAPARRLQAHGDLALDARQPVDGVVRPLDPIILYNCLTYII